MFFRSPIFRLVAHDFDYMLSREMRRNERVMARELERALDSFAALEEEAIQRRHHHQQQRHRHNFYRHSHEARPQETRKEAVKPQDIKNEAIKPRENKAEAVKPQDSKADSVKPQEKEHKQESRLQPQYQRGGDVFSAWNNSFDDFFFRDTSPFGYRYRSPFDDFHYRTNPLDKFADEMSQIRAEVDKHFKNSEAPQEYPKLKDPENTSYFMRVETNDNGNVRVKTVQKNPGSEWVTKFEEYKRNNSTAAVEKDTKSEAKQAVENKEQKLETNEKKEKPVEIAEEPYNKSSGSSAASVSA